MGVEPIVLRAFALTAGAEPRDAEPWNAELPVDAVDAVLTGTDDHLLGP